MAFNCILQLKDDTTRIKPQYLQQRIASNSHNVKGIKSIFAKHSRIICCKNRLQKSHRIFNDKRVELKTGQMGRNAYRIPFWNRACQWIKQC